MPVREHVAQSYLSTGFNLDGRRRRGPTNARQLPLGNLALAVDGDAELLPN